MGQTFEDVRRFKAGDADALGRLYERYYERVLSFVRIRMGPRLRARIDPEDLVQRTFLVAMDRLPDFEMREPGALIHWLATIAEHQIRDQRKYFAQKKRDWDRERPLAAPGFAGSSSWSAIALAGSTTPPPERVARAEVARILEECIEELSEDHKQVILLRMVAGASLEYTAQQLGRQTPQAVAMLYSRARIKLMQAVERRLGE
jgi:RNA polymerase sigma-70 factor (ECF subfamily)